MGFNLRLFEIKLGTKEQLHHPPSFEREVFLLNKPVLFGIETETAAARQRFWNYATAADEWLFSKQSIGK